MQENIKAPSVRFAGFADSWERQEFKDTFDLLTNNTLSRAELNNEQGVAQNVHYGDILTKLGEVIDLKVDCLPYITDDLKASKSSVLQNGDVIIADTAEDSAVGKCAEIIGISDANVVAGLHTIPCRPRKQYAQGYLGYFMNSPAYHDQLLPLMQGTKVTSVSKAALQDTILCYPTDIQEQTLIGDYFRRLDDLISLYRRKYVKLVDLKKSMLEKMFPKDGADVPEVRFKGFVGAWEKHKVSDLLVERNEQSPKSNEYPLMAFIAYKGVAPKGERYDRSSLVNDTENKLYKRTEIGDFIYSSNNLETGSIGLNNYGCACISPVYSIFSTTAMSDSYFIGQRFVKKDFINEMVKWRQGVIYGQWRIHEDDFLKIEVLVPSVPEQEKIGRFLRSLDDRIALQQRELEKLQSIKKALLEKMFV